MRKRDEIADPTSCLNKARDNEWLFVLLGRDAAATITVRFWIEERIRLGLNFRTDAKIQDAEEWIKAVQTERETKGEVS